MYQTSQRENKKRKIKKKINKPCNYRPCEIHVVFAVVAEDLKQWPDPASCFERLIHQNVPPLTSSWWLMILKEEANF